LAHKVAPGEHAARVIDRITVNALEVLARMSPTPGHIVGKTPDQARPGHRPRRFRARGWATGMLVTLLVQFGLGMFTNLFIHIPSNHPGAGEHNYFTATGRGIAWLETSKDAPVVVATHAGVGLTLVIGAVWMVTLAFRVRARPLVSWSAVLGGLFILGAAINGASFLDYNDDVNSFLMAMFFAAAVTCYGLILAQPAGSQAAARIPAAPTRTNWAERTPDVDGIGQE
jgi:hypothetical protein